MNLFTKQKQVHRHCELLFIKKKRREVKKNAINSSGTHLTVEGFVNLQNIKRTFMNQYENKHQKNNEKNFKEEEAQVTCKL